MRAAVAAAVAIFEEGRIVVKRCRRWRGPGRRWSEWRSERACVEAVVAVILDRIAEQAPAVRRERRARMERGGDEKDRRSDADGKSPTSP